MGSRTRINDIRLFLRRQSHNYRMMLVRSGGAMFFMNLTSNYTSIFTTELGADAVTLGSLSSVSALISTIISIPAGWVMDNYNLKKVMGIGMIFQILMISFYAFAQNWIWILVAMFLNPFTMALMFRSQNVMISNGLRDEDRATGMGLRMMTAQVLGLISPIPAALLVEYLGGLTVEGIRPLFYIRLIGTLLVYVYVYYNLVDIAIKPRKGKLNFIQDFKDVVVGKEGLKAWIISGGLGAIVWSTTMPFTILYCKEVKGADALTLGLLTTISTISTLIFAIPMNQIADTKGRKYAFFLTRPAIWIWFIILIFAPTPQWLLVAYVFRGVGMSSSAYGTMGVELVPPEQRGRWLGITNTFSGLLRIPAPILGGILYDGPIPALLFVVPLIVDLFIRSPILYFKVPETLNLKHE